MTTVRVRAWGSLTVLWAALWAVLSASAAVAQTLPQAGPPGPPAPRRDEAGVITTHAEARRRLPNTVSDAGASIEVHGRDLRGTAALLAQRSQALLSYLRAQPTERLRTEGTSFEPEVQEVRGQPDRIKGYTGRTTVSFRTAPDQLPLLLAGCLDNGATGLAQSGSSPREEEVEAARRDLAAEATQAALAQARAIAQVAGQRVMGVELVEVDPARAPESGLPVASYAPGRAARPTPPIASEAGDAGLTVAVVLTMRVAPPD